VLYPSSYEDENCVLYPSSYEDENCVYGAIEDGIEQLYILSLMVAAEDGIDECYYPSLQ
jgi:hypothetical protein